MIAILQLLSVIMTALAPLLKGDPTAQDAEALAAAVLQIGAAANAAHVAIAGKPIDLSQLNPIDPL